jgi:hypothetical protein
MSDIWCRHSIRAAAIAFAAAASPLASAADAADQSRPRDAAEAVQEGSVANWIKYYQRERDQQPAPVQDARSDGGAPARQPAPKQGPPAGEAR